MAFEIVANLDDLEPGQVHEWDERLQRLEPRPGNRESDPLLVARAEQDDLDVRAFRSLQRRLDLPERRVAHRLAVREVG